MTFCDNHADYGGAVYTEIYSDMTFDGNSTVIFNSNVVSQSGGALNLRQNFNISFIGNVQIIFHNNSAKYGASLHSSRICNNVW